MTRCFFTAVSPTHVPLLLSNSGRTLTATCKAASDQTPPVDMHQGYPKNTVLCFFSIATGLLLILTAMCIATNDHVCLPRVPHKTAIAF